MQLQLGQVQTIVVSSAEMAEQIMKTHDIIFSQRPYVLAAQVMSYNSTAIIFTPYGNYWRQMRKICMMELLSANRVQSFRSIREEEVSDLIQSMYTEGGSPVNFEYIPFGSGRRICPGIMFAMRSIELALANLLYYFDWKLPGDEMKFEDLEMTESSGLTARRKHDLLLIPIPYWN